MLSRPTAKLDGSYAGRKKRVSEGPPECVPAALLKGLSACREHLWPKGTRGAVQLNRHVRISAGTSSLACTQGQSGGMGVDGMTAGDVNLGQRLAAVCNACAVAPRMLVFLQMCECGDSGCWWSWGDNLTDY